MDFYVYAWTNRHTGSRYIGKGRGDRALRHLSDVRGGRRRCPAFHDAVKKYGEDVFELGYIATDLDEPTAFSVERAFIAMYRTTESGYNLTEGGEGCAGAKRSPEQVEAVAAKNRGRKRTAEFSQRMSDLHKGRPKSEATRAKLSAANRGRTATPEARAKMTQARTGQPGKPHSAESKAKMSAAKKGKPGPVKTPEHLAAIKAALQSYWQGRRKA